MKFLEELDCDLSQASSTVEEACSKLNECLNTAKKMRSKAGKNWKKEIQKIVNDIDKLQAELEYLYTEEVEPAANEQFCKENGLS